VKPRSFAAVKREWPQRHVFSLTASEPGRGATVWSIDGPLTKEQFDDLFGYILQLISKGKRPPPPAPAAGSGSPPPAARSAKTGG